MILKESIKQLNKNTIIKIASGEVIENQISVIKELIENSIDANSRNITIYLENYGKDKIIVEDDGFGMCRTDAMICFLDHTTSKINDYKDLSNIKTLGFRGEALSSICTISKCEIITKDKYSDTGIYLEIINSCIKKEQKVISNTGTKVIISNLFYNNPSRKKNLENNNIKLIEIINYIKSISLCYNAIHFKLYNNNKKLCSYLSSNLLDSIVNVFGINIAKNMIKIYNKKYIDNKQFVIEGYLSNPSFTKLVSSNIIIIVNNRIIKSKLLIQHIKNSCNTFIQKNKYPYLVLKINVPLDFVDVNINPQKNKVRFYDDNIIFSLIDDIIKKEYSKYEKNDLKNIKYELLLDKLTNEKYNSNESYNNKCNNNYYLDNKIKNKLLRSQNIINKICKKNYYINNSLELKLKNTEVIGQLFKLYIVLEKKDTNELILIDQHAVHEKIIYSYLKKDTLNQSYYLKNRIYLEFSNNEKILIEDKLSLLKKYGFNIIFFGNNSYVIDKLPLYMRNININDIKDFIIEFIKNEKNILKIKDEIFKKISCKSAIRSGDICNNEQIKQLLNQLIHIEDPFTCPHGRPSIITIKKETIDKIFKRI